jgi:hypothetical protein
VVEKVALEQVSSEYFGSPDNCHPIKCSILNSRGCPDRPTYQVDSALNHPKKIKKTAFFVVLLISPCRVLIISLLFSNPLNVYET